jgi:AraC family transcriptional regulator, arabinose operon regulatory protein
MARVTGHTKTRKRKHVREVPAHVLDTEYFFYDSEYSKDEKLVIIGGGSEKCAPDYQISRKKYPYYAIVYTVSGKGTFFLNSAAHELNAGVLWRLTPRDVHRYCCDPSDPMEQIHVVFTGTEARSLLAKSSLLAKGALEVVNPAGTLYLLREIVRTAIEKRPYSHELCLSYLRAILLREAIGTGATGKDYPMSLETYHRCKQYIDANFPHITSSTDVAQACAVDIRYMARLFRRYGKITPHNYILRIKLNKAASMLLASGFFIEEISYSLGFHDPFHFSRVFKRFHGLSPRHFRQMHRGLFRETDR